MSYPGGKAGAGVYQSIINQIPPHAVYIEPFAGSAAIARFKAPAAETVLVDIHPGVIEDLVHSVPLEWLLVQGDGLEYLRKRRWHGDEFVYCDPPYLMESRATKARIYRHEFSTRAQHLELLAVLKAIPAAVEIMISGYPNTLYGDVLRSWRTHRFTSVTRGGTKAVECLWMNYPDPVVLHDYRFLGRSFRERERIKRKQNRWKRRLEQLDPLEREALFWAIRDLGLPSVLRPVSPGAAIRDPIAPSGDSPRSDDGSRRQYVS